MISKEDFIINAANKKIHRQKYFVKTVRFICQHLPLSFTRFDKKKGDYVFVTICKSKDFDMTMCSLYSLYRNSEIIPKSIIVVSDGSWKENEGIKYFEKYGLNVECISWKLCADYYSNIYPSLTKWAYKQIWGKKMVSILYYSEKNNVLFSDPDILWYNTPISEKELKETKFKVSIDNSHNYDMDFISQYNFYDLIKTENPINCGAVYISGGLQTLSDKAKLCIDYEAEHTGKFAEQTVFAIMDLKYNCRWNMNEITSEIDDLLKPFFSKTIKYPDMIARHYLWRLKWIYWKDFMQLVLKDTFKQIK